VSAGIAQCSGFLNNMQNFIFLPILNIIKVTIPFTFYTLARKIT
jgi:hypothetical protein